jgi:hypothetical protein
VHEVQRANLVPSMEPVSDLSARRALGLLVDCARAGAPLSALPTAGCSTAAVPRVWRQCRRPRAEVSADVRRWQRALSQEPDQVEALLVTTVETFYQWFDGPLALHLFQEP